jgi:hypothetical protein
VQKPDGTALHFSGIQGKLSGSCGTAKDNVMELHSTCTATYNFNADQSGKYTVNARLSATRAGGEPALAHIGVDAETAPEQSTARGAVLIRNKLVELHQKLLGKTVAADSAEINALYALLIQTWNAKRTSTLAKNLHQSNTSCNEWVADPHYAQHVGYPGQARTLRVSANGTQWMQYDWANIHPWLYTMAHDSMYMKQTWVVIMSYYMTHYNYLHE